ncbi:MAG: M23 family metallopeptidase [Betaproteobacteria bacterium]
MNIIFVSERSARAKTLNINTKFIVMVVSVMLAFTLMLAGAMNIVLLKYADQLHVLPYLQKMLVEERNKEDQSQTAQSYVKDNLNAMANRLGQLQAQLLRIDTVGERLASLAGVKPQDLHFRETLPESGPMAIPTPTFTLSQLQHQIERFTKTIDDRGEKMGFLESLFTFRDGKKHLIPTMRPVATGDYSSNFGWRVDPITGQRAFHEGIDFGGEVGTPIVAAAGGVVVFAGFHPAYGNMIEIDHGNDIVTRYAHANGLNVKVGEMVLRGAQIAQVGHTGRVTGTHLHFEVRQRGIALDPAQFLQLPT